MRLMCLFFLVFYFYGKYISLSGTTLACILNWFGYVPSNFCWMFFSVFWTSFAQRLDFILMLTKKNSSSSFTFFSMVIFSI